jgi:Alpha-L-fucosidase
MDILSAPEYEKQLADSRDERMAWWREARFGLFIHIGLYTALGRNEWAMGFENWPVEEYEKLADRFTVKPGAAREWARLAKAAGMKYAVLTTRHHEGFSLWDSKVNPFNSVNYGPKRDIVQEFVDACRAEGLRIGFYSSLMDWHHPDGGRAACDSAARQRFCDYIEALNMELLTNYGQIDVLWYDVPCPMEHHEGWHSLERNQRLRAIQPNIIINNRSHLSEDFGTPEEHLTADEKHDWEACMTFNGISWGYVDSAQAVPYSYNAQRILRMLQTVSAGGGNLLLNIGPTPDGAVPTEAIEPLTAVGSWLAANGDCAYGKVERHKFQFCNGVTSVSLKGNMLYLWNWIWPKDGEIILGGFTTRLRSAKILSTGQTLDFTQEEYQIRLQNLPADSPDSIAGVAVLALEFEKAPFFRPFAYRPSLNNGRTYIFSEED